MIRVMTAHCLRNCARCPAAVRRDAVQSRPSAVLRVDVLLPPRGHGHEHFLDGECAAKTSQDQPRRGRVELGPRVPHEEEHRGDQQRHDQSRGHDRTRCCRRDPVGPGGVCVDPAQAQERQRHRHVRQQEHDGTEREQAPEQRVNVAVRKAEQHTVDQRDAGAHQRGHAGSANGRAVFGVDPLEHRRQVALLGGFGGGSVRADRPRDQGGEERVQDADADQVTSTPDPNTDLRTSIRPLVSEISSAGMTICMPIVEIR